MSVCLFVVGGIYTVIKSKAPVSVAELGEQYCLLGPYNEACVRTEVEILEPSHYVYRQTLQTMRDAGIKVSQIMTGMYSLYHKKCSQVSGLVPVILGKVLMFNHLILHYKYFFLKSTKWWMFDKITELQKRTYTDLGRGRKGLYLFLIYFNYFNGKIAQTIACFIYGTFSEFLTYSFCYPVFSGAVQNSSSINTICIIMASTNIFTWHRTEMFNYFKKFLWQYFS